MQQAVAKGGFNDVIFLDLRAILAFSWYKTTTEKIHPAFVHEEIISRNSRREAR